MYVCMLLYFICMHVCMNVCCCTYMVPMSPSSREVINSQSIINLIYVQVDEITDSMTEGNMARFLKDKLNVPQRYCRILEG